MGQIKNIKLHIVTDIKQHTHMMEVNVEHILSTFQQQVDSFKDYLSIIPWTETWMVCLMVFHLLVCLPFVLLTKKYHNVQYCAFFTLLVLVYLSERINRLLRSDSHQLSCIDCCVVAWCSFYVGHHQKETGPVVTEIIINNNNNRNIARRQEREEKEKRRRRGGERRNTER